MVKVRPAAYLVAFVFAVTATASAGPALAASAAEIDRDVNVALQTLYGAVPDTRQLGTQAKAVLVFPSIVKAGFLFGAQYGEGALRRQARTAGYYSTVAASYGFQAGIQRFGYALFFMSDSALRHLENTGGFELGAGPSIVILDVGAAKALTTTTAHKDIYAVFFDQRGLMAGVGIQGSKISRMDR
jgi:lipid-binding SYLF domain-containing protein